MGSLRSPACAPLRTVLLAVFFSVFVSFAAAEVGVYSSEVLTVNRRDVLGAGMWSMGPEGCKLGRAGNLVVTPMPGSTAQGAQILDPYFTGPQVCSWLSMVQEAHYGLRSAWEEEHARQRQQVPKWNLLKRYSMWKQTFPDLEVDVEVRFLALWDKDRFGHPLPWATVLFKYGCPDKESNYGGMFNHLCGAVFSQNSDPRVPTEVYLLLNPRPGFNRPIDVSASKWQFVTGAISGLSGGGGSEDAEEEEGGNKIAGTLSLLQSLYVKSNAFATLQGTINDCWMYNGQCYFRWPLRMEWRILGETFCERLHRQANEDVSGAFKSAAFSSVQVHVFSLNLFAFDRPVLYAVADEGVVGVNDSSGLLTLQIDTRPENIPNFERSKQTAKNVRTANLIFKGVSSLLGKGKKQKDDDDE
ncbi:hypothetical protein, conserved [Eimeria brunetti]|uniref:Dense granule protein GRA12 n=1 Tax=Eimeria brunetti TaxID=51314 RepID=U6LTK7_9EIME|nr:hypothetical protein, conserved [Eimeria brunetti]